MDTNSLKMRIQHLKLIVRIRIQRSILITIFVTLLILLITAFLRDNLPGNTFDDKFKIFLTLLGVIITTYLGIIKQVSDNNKALRELFVAFNEKYSGKMNDIFNLLRQHDLGPYDINKQERLLIIDYFNLCAEEYYWFNKNVIPFSVWKAWEAGIIENISIPKVKDVLTEETNSERKKKSYYGFVEYILSKIPERT